MDKKYGIMWERNQTKFEHWLEKYEDFLQSFYNLTINKILSNRKQKIKIRIDRSDTWSMDNTLAHIILPMLKQLKETKQGSPLVDDEDVPEYLRSTSAPLKENEWDLDEYHFKRWDWVLNEMIFAFEAKAMDDWEEQFYSGEIDIRWEKKENGLSQIVNGPKNTFKVDSEGRKKYHDRMTNGFRLFGKYYESLWD
jgi:viroplasmin and RNaseH domain-containing protein